MRSLLATLALCFFLPSLLQAAEPADAAAANPDSISGIGAAVALSDNQLVIRQVLPNTPAERAGLLAGDTVIAIDGQPIEGLPLADAVALLRGAPYTSVQLNVIRNASAQPVTYTVMRDTIQITPPRE